MLARGLTELLPLAVCRDARVDVTERGVALPRHGDATRTTAYHAVSLPYGSRLSQYVYPLIVLRDARSVMNGSPSLFNPYAALRFSELTHHDARTTMHPPPLDISAPGQGHVSW